ncbi:MAG: hypothetical protein QXE05_04555, partial [Nitrososphaeria archaeon]
VGMKHHLSLLNSELIGISLRKQSLKALSFTVLTVFFTSSSLFKLKIFGTISFKSFSMLYALWAVGVNISDSSMSSSLPTLNYGKWFPLELLSKLL